MTVTVISDEAVEVAGRVDDGRVWVEIGELQQAIGWQLKAEGLCRHDVCVLVPDRSALEDDGHVDVGAVADLLGRRRIVDAGAGVVAMSLDAEARRQALVELRAPSFTLPDLDGRLRSLEEWRGRRRMLFAFSSW